MELELRSNLTGAVHYLKIEDYPETTSVYKSNCIKSTFNVRGYDWEVRFYHSHANKVRGEPREEWVALKFGFHGEPRVYVRADLRCRLVHPGRNGGPSDTEMDEVSSVFYRGGPYSPELLLIRSDDVPSSGYLKKDCLTVECTLTVLEEPSEDIPAEKVAEPLPPPVPSSDLHQHLGALLQSQKGGDVTFVIASSGERFLAHKCILAARSPVFMAEFFGNMAEGSSLCVQIEDVDAAAFKAMLHFIYADTVPELDEDSAVAVIMAQHLLAAADRYGLDRLKVICEGKLARGIDVATAATTLALAEQHNCSLLTAKCVEFVTESPEKLDAVLATEGYKHLAESCPMVLAELLKAARGRKN